MVYLVILLVLAITLRRELVLLPFLLVTLFMTIGQQIIVAGLSMTVLRITLVFIWVRVLARGEHKRIQPSLLDNWLVGWLLIRTVVNIILWRAQGSVIIGNLGHVYDALGIYFLFRIMITNNEELRRIVIFVCALSIPLCAMVLVEHFTGHNPFAVFGGVPETVVMRDGRARCQGPFRHAILAGTFGATTMPFAVGLVRDWDLRVRRIGIVSVASNVVDRIPVGLQRTYLGNSCSCRSSTALAFTGTHENGSENYANRVTRPPTPNESADLVFVCTNERFAGHGRRVVPFCPNRCGSRPLRRVGTDGSRLYGALDVVSTDAKYGGHN